MISKLNLFDYITVKEKHNKKWSNKSAWVSPQEIAIPLPVSVFFNKIL